MNCLILGWVTPPPWWTSSPFFSARHRTRKNLATRARQPHPVSLPSASRHHTALLICIFVLISLPPAFTPSSAALGSARHHLFQFVLKMEWSSSSPGSPSLKSAASAHSRCASHRQRRNRKGRCAVAIRSTSFQTFRHGFTSEALWTIPLISFASSSRPMVEQLVSRAETRRRRYVAQRIFLRQRRKKFSRATLWFNIAHYALRPWPWIVTRSSPCTLSRTAASRPAKPSPQNHEQGYVMVLRDFSAAPLRGLMVAAFLAAFHVHHRHPTQLEATSYLVKRSLPPLPRQRQHRKALRQHQQTFSPSYRSLLADGFRATRFYLHWDGRSSSASVPAPARCLSLRWYWWRINAWSEIVATIAPPFTFVLANMKFSGNSAVVTAKDDAPHRRNHTILWLRRNFPHQTRPQEKLVSFYAAPSQH